MIRFIRMPTAAETARHRPRITLPGGVAPRLQWVPGQLTFATKTDNESTHSAQAEPRHSMFTVHSDLPPLCREL